MVNKKHNYTKSGEPLPIDESWWMAVLEDVEDRFESNSRVENAVSHPTTGVGAQPETNTQTEAIDPDWEKAKELYQRDEVIEMEVTGHNRGGILVAGDSLLGFVPISHLVQISRKCDDENGPQKDLEAYHGKTIRLKVIECDPERGRVVFSERAAKTDTGRRIQLLDDLNEGDCLHGNITTITDFGAFVDLGGIEGLIHISELSWGRVRRPSDVVTVGQQVEVCVIQIDRKRSRVALSLKRLLPNPWDTAENHYHQGQIIDAVITSVVSFGAFARLESGLDGLIHASEMGDNGHEGAKPNDILYEGQRVQVCVLQIDSNRQRLGLSLQTIYD
ncbi:30S ribosomal protein S1 [Chloroflexota bacterium]